MLIRNSSAPFKSQSDRSAANTPPSTKHVMFSRDASDRNIETVLSFKIVQRSYNKAFGVDTNRQNLRTRVVSYVPGALKEYLEGVAV